MDRYVLRTVVLLAAVSTTSCVHGTQMGQTEGRPTSERLTATAVAAPHGMIVTDSDDGTQVGVQIMQAGGNAVDAAVASAFAMAVAYPEAGNIGGGGFAIVRLADGTTAALDFREMAPAKATRDMYLDANGNVTSKSLVGHLASGVPGSVAGLWELHHRFGSKPWGDLLQPAIDLARNGFVVSEHTARVIAGDRRLSNFPASKQLLMPNGQVPAPGTRLSNPDMARTLERIQQQGRDGFYKGETADLIVAEMQRGNGLISHEDLAGYQPKWREAIQFTYRGHRIIAMPPSSSGGITLALMANILEGYDLHALGAESAERYHLIAEASRRAFADRNEFLGDMDFVKVPLATLLSPDYAARQRATISSQHATPSAEVRPGLGSVSEGTQTTHMSFVDDKGNAVALTTTLNELFGSAVTVTGGGFFLNDEMDDFTAKVGAPNMFGLIQGAANSIAPGKRMLSAMCPTIVLGTDGKPMLITGARGGPRIISAAFQIISNVLDHGMALPDAVTAPRIHMQHLPDSLYHEQGAFTPEVKAALEKMGHHITLRDGYIGDAPTILRVGDHWVGTADPRSNGLAKGF